MPIGPATILSDLSRCAGLQAGEHGLDNADERCATPRERAPAEANKDPRRRTRDPFWLGQGTRGLKVGRRGPSLCCSQILWNCPDCHKHKLSIMLKAKQLLCAWHKLRVTANPAERTPLNTSGLYERGAIRGECQRIEGSQDDDLARELVVAELLERADVSHDTSPCCFEPATTAPLSCWGH